MENLGCINALRRVVDSIWSVVGNELMSKEEFKQYMKQCMDTIEARMFARLNWYKRYRKSYLGNLILTIFFSYALIYLAGYLLILFCCLQKVPCSEREWLMCVYLCTLYKHINNLVHMICSNFVTRIPVKLQFCLIQIDLDLWLSFSEHSILKTDLQIMLEVMAVVVLLQSCDYSSGAWQPHCNSPCPTISPYLYPFGCLPLPWG